MMNLFSFITPLEYAARIYNLSDFELPVFRQDTFFPTIVHKNDTDYNQVLQNQPGFHIKKKIEPVLQNENIREDLIVIERPHQGLSCAQGTNMFSNGDAVIVVEPGFYDMDPEACLWAMKHEISHIKNNDAFTIPFIGAVCSSAAAIFGSLKMKWLPATILTISVGVTVTKLFTRYREGKADDFAIENCSSDELLGGRRCLKAFQELSSPNGICIDHPSVLSRIQKIEQALEDRGVVINEQTENQKIKNLKAFIKPNLTEI
jgi:Peptidase family M48